MSAFLNNGRTRGDRIVRKRKIIRIDEEKCDGCGKCVTNCPEGALQVVGGKAKLVRGSYCDGLGACIGDCPHDAITIEEREAEEFDAQAVEEHRRGHTAAQCPGAALMSFGDGTPATAQTGGQASALRQWPVQLRLVPAGAAFLDGADLLLCADCVPFALAAFHGELLAGKRLLVGSPKFDDAAAYLAKLTDILRQHEVRSLTVAHMEVPCCHGLLRLAQRAIEASGKDVPLRIVVVGVRGEMESVQETSLAQGRDRT